MTFGVAAPKLQCLYTDDEGTARLSYHTQDVITAGSFAQGAAENDLMPSRGRLIPRHWGLRTADSLHRTHIPISTQSAFNAHSLGDSITYGGIAWIIVSKTGEKQRTRA
jgi:hypothetical protein